MNRAGAPLMQRAEVKAASHALRVASGHLRAAARAQRARSHAILRRAPRRIAGGAGQSIEREQVLAGLASGLLWVLEAGPVWAGRGTLKPCVVCRVRIGLQDIQYDVAGPLATVAVHLRCFRAWRRHSEELRRNNGDAAH
jgi:hypothetical protein